MVRHGLRQLSRLCVLRRLARSAVSDGLARQEPRISTFDLLEKRGDTAKATEKGQGARLPISVIGRNRPPTR